MNVITLDEAIHSGDISLGRGNIISTKDIAAFPGDYPIYSSSAKGAGEFGRYAHFMFNEELITWSVDGGGRFFYRPKHKFSVTNVCGYLRVDQSKWNMQFVYYSLDFQHRQIAFDYQMKAHPSVIRHLYRLSNEPEPVQTKIAEILSTVDRAIEETESLIAKQERIKTGLMQDLLTRGIDEHGNLRSENTHQFKDSSLGRIPVEWEVKTVGAVISDIDAGWSPSCPDETPAEGEWGVLKVSAVSSGVYQPSESKRLPTELTPVESIEVKVGDVLMTRSNGVADLVGKCVLVERTPAKLMLSDKTLRLCPSADEITPFVLFATLSSHTSRLQILASLNGSSGQKNISQTQIRSLRLRVPLVNEQEQVEQVLQAQITRITQSITHLKKLQLLKAALMHDLLTGEKQVTPLLEPNTTT